jgi:hypothetical protein
MAESKCAANEDEISHDRLAELLNDDLAREYQATIAYVVYSQVLTGAQYMDIAAQSRSCPDPFAADRLSRQNAGGHSQAGTHIEKFGRHAPV